MTRKKAAPRKEREPWSNAQKAQVAAATLGNPAWPLVGAAGVVVSYLGAARLLAAARGLLAPRAPVSVTVGAPDTRGLFDFLRERDADERRERASLLDLLREREAPAAPPAPGAPSPGSPAAPRSSLTADFFASARDSARAQSRAAHPFFSTAASPGAAPSQAESYFGNPEVDRYRMAQRERELSFWAPPAGIPAPGTTPVGGNWWTSLGSAYRRTLVGAHDFLGGVAVGSVESVPPTIAGAIDFFGGAAGRDREVTRITDPLREFRLFPETDSTAFEVGRAAPVGIGRLATGGRVLGLASASGNDSGRRRDRTSAERKARGAVAFESYMASTQSKKDADYTANAIKRAQEQPWIQRGF